MPVAAFPGGFIKREGRPSEKEVLTCRQIDRPIRPLFPENFRNETQVIALVMSADKENDPDVIGINAAAAALALSDIPFNGPVGAVRVGRLNDQFVINPTYAERKESTLNIMVVGTKDGIVMVESGSKEVSEELVFDAIEFGPRGSEEDRRGNRRVGIEGGQAEACGARDCHRPRVCGGA